MMYHLFAIFLSTTVLSTSLTVFANPAQRNSNPVASANFPNHPLVSHIFTADPSAHVFNNVLYVYPSHDVDSDIKPDGEGSHFDMHDYHVLSMNQIGGAVTDHGVALHVDQVPWAQKQMWAPDAAEKDGLFYLFFPAKDYNGIFRIGVAKSTNPTGPFIPEPKPIDGTYSIDPTVFQDDDGSYYLYVGGIQGGQLQRWQQGFYIDQDSYPSANDAMLMPKMARLSNDLTELDHPLKDIVILDKKGTPLKQGDHKRKFFEAAWIHKYQGTYYLSYSTGHSHFIQYATANNPYGPFTWQGKVLEPVLGWTNHHSIVEYNGKWYLFYHDSSLSAGRTHLRSVKVTELVHNEDGSIQTIDAYLGD